MCTNGSRSLPMVNEKFKTERLDALEHARHEVGMGRERHQWHTPCSCRGAGRVPECTLQRRVHAIGKVPSSFRSMLDLVFGNRRAPCLLFNIPM